MDDSLKIADVGDSYGSNKNALLQDLILDKILRDPILSFDDLKQCRLVCKKWEELSKRNFTKRSTIVFRFNEYDMYDSFSLSTILYGTSDLDSVEHPFYSFRFENFIPFHPPIFEDFIKSQGSVIKELFFDDVCLLMSPYNFSPLIGKTITKLTLTDLKNRIPFLEVNFEKLVSIEYLCLYNCAVFVKNNQSLKVRPKELTIHNVVFEGEDERIIPFSINDYFILDDHIKKLTYKLSLDHLKYTLDLNCNVDLDTLDLQGIELVNWNDTKWLAVKNLTLSTSSIENSNIRQLVHSNMKSEWMSLSFDVNMTMFPKSVQKIFLLTTHDMHQRPLPHLPELRFLSLGNYRNLKYFKNCPLLKDLHLKKPTRTESIRTEVVNSFVRRIPVRVSMDVNDIPQAVKRMVIEKINICGNGTKALETLVVSHYQWDEIDNLLEKLKPDKLVISGIIKYGVERVTKLLQRNFKSLTVGEPF